MAFCAGFKLAVSNLFQVIKSKTAAGFVPNFAAGGLRSQDRTEPPIGAKVPAPANTIIRNASEIQTGWSSRSERRLNVETTGN